MNKSTNGGMTWKTFPERLQDAGISWKSYQNELTRSGLGRRRGCMALEFRGQRSGMLRRLQCRGISGIHSGRGAMDFRSFRRCGEARIADLAAEKDPAAAAQASGTAGRDSKTEIEAAQGSRLPKAAKRDTISSPSNRKHCIMRHSSPMPAILTTTRWIPLSFESEGKIAEHEGSPQGDILYQFRKDVNEGKLPTISWLSAPEKFSDHPTSPWYGAWYISEVMDISDEESRGLEEDDLHPHLRRERRLLRSCPVVRGGRPEAP